ncbi:hypothetical protein [Pasteuria penetrans]|uniref:hypothetical protein n=1 Tax=Pasteuria penetrans TaxID=86005 RepID=UPI001CAA4B9D|nr:hypothetical protein [Pasteuria penetrans]
MLELASPEGIEPNSIRSGYVPSPGFSKPTKRVDQGSFFVLKDCGDNTNPRQYR